MGIVYRPGVSVVRAHCTLCDIKENFEVVGLRENICDDDFDSLGFDIASGSCVTVLFARRVELCFLESVHKLGPPAKRLTGATSPGLQRFPTPPLLQARR